MIPVYQTKFSSHTDPTQHGSCLRACLASLFELNQDNIPFFEEMGNDWALRMFSWLKSIGYEYNGCGKSKDVNSYKIGVNGYYIVNGPSPRYKHCTHAVIYYRGKFVHDPHPEGNGLEIINDYFMIEKIKRYENC